MKRTTFLVVSASLVLLSACKKDTADTSGSPKSISNSTFDVLVTLSGEPVDIAENQDGEIYVLLDEGTHASVAKFDDAGVLEWEVDFSTFPGQAQNIVAIASGEAVFTVAQNDFQTSTQQGPEGQIQQGLVYDSLNDCAPNFAFGNCAMEVTGNNSTLQVVHIDELGSIVGNHALAGDATQGCSIAAIDSGYVVASANSKGINAEIDYFGTYTRVNYPADENAVTVTKFDHSDSQEWQTMVSNIVGGGAAKAQYVTVLDVAVSGSNVFTRTMHEVCRFSAIGTLQDRFNPVHGYCSNAILGIAPVFNGELFVHGAFTDNGQPAQRYVSRVGSSGTSSWQVQEPSGASNLAVLRNAGIDQLLVGNFDGTGKVSKMSASGTIL